MQYIHSTSQRCLQPCRLAVLHMFVHLHVTVHRSHCVQVYRIEYPGEILVLFDLSLEGGSNISVSVPEFYLVTLSDLNDRETFEVIGMSMLTVSVWRF